MRRKLAIYTICFYFVLFTVHARSCDYAKDTITKVYHVKRDSHKRVKTILQSTATAPILNQEMYRVKADCENNIRTVSFVYDEQFLYHTTAYHAAGLEYKPKNPMAFSDCVNNKRCDDIDYQCEKKSHGNHNNYNDEDEDDYDDDSGDDDDSPDDDYDNDNDSEDYNGDEDDDDRKYRNYEDNKDDKEDEDCDEEDENHTQVDNEHRRHHHHHHRHHHSRSECDSWWREGDELEHDYEWSHKHGEWWHKGCDRSCREHVPKQCNVPREHLSTLSTKPYTTKKYTTLTTSSNNITTRTTNIDTEKRTTSPKTQIHTTKTPYTDYPPKKTTTSVKTTNHSSKTLTTDKKTSSLSSITKPTTISSLEKASSTKPITISSLEKVTSTKLSSSHPESTYDSTTENFSIEKTIPSIPINAYSTTILPKPSASTYSQVITSNTPQIFMSSQSTPTYNSVRSLLGTPDTVPGASLPASSLSTQSYQSSIAPPLVVSSVFTKTKAFTTTLLLPPISTQLSVTPSSTHVTPEVSSDIEKPMLSSFTYETKPAISSFSSKTLSLPSVVLEPLTSEYKPHSLSSAIPEHTVPQNSQPSSSIETMISVKQTLSITDMIRSSDTPQKPFSASTQLSSAPQASINTVYEPTISRPQIPLSEPVMSSQRVYPSSATKESTLLTISSTQKIQSSFSSMNPSSTHFASSLSKSQEDILSKSTVSEKSQVTTVSVTIDEFSSFVASITIQATPSSSKTDPFSSFVASVLTQATPSSSKVSLSASASTQATPSSSKTNPFSSFVTSTKIQTASSASQPNVVSSFFTSVSIQATPSSTRTDPFSSFVASVLTQATPSSSKVSLSASASTQATPSSSKTDPFSSFATSTKIQTASSASQPNVVSSFFTSVSIQATPSSTKTDPFSSFVASVLTQVTLSPSRVSQSSLVSPTEYREFPPASSTIHSVSLSKTSESTPSALSYTFFQTPITSASGSLVSSIPCASSLMGPDGKCQNAVTSNTISVENSISSPASYKPREILSIPVTDDYKNSFNPSSTSQTTASVQPPPCKTPGMYTTTHLSLDESNGIYISSVSTIYDLMDCQIETKTINTPSCTPNGMGSNSEGLCIQASSTLLSRPSITEHPLTTKSQSLNSVASAQPSSSFTYSTSKPAVTPQFPAFVSESSRIISQTASSLQPTASEISSLKTQDKEHSTIMSSKSAPDHTESFATPSIVTVTTTRDAVYISTLTVSVYPTHVSPDCETPEETYRPQLPQVYPEETYRPQLPQVYPEETLPRCSGKACGGRSPLGNGSSNSNSDSRGGSTGSSGSSKGPNGISSGSSTYCGFEGCTSYNDHTGLSNDVLEGCRSGENCLRQGGSSGSSSSSSRSCDADGVCTTTSSSESHINNPDGSSNSSNSKSNGNNGNWYPGSGGVEDCDDQTSLPPKTYLNSHNNKPKNINECTDCSRTPTNPSIPGYGNINTYPDIGNHNTQAPSNTETIEDCEEKTVLTEAPRLEPVKFDNKNPETTHCSECKKPYTNTTPQVGSNGILENQAETVRPRPLPPLDYNRPILEESPVLGHCNNCAQSSRPPQSNNAPITNAPIANKPMANTPVANIPVANTPIVNTPMVNTPVSNAPVANMPAVNTPVANTPMVNIPAANTPVVNAPVSNIPVANVSAVIENSSTENKKQTPSSSENENRKECDKCQKASNEEQKDEKVFCKSCNLESQVPSKANQNDQFTPKENGPTKESQNLPQSNPKKELPQPKNEEGHHSPENLPQKEYPQAKDENNKVLPANDSKDHGTQECNDCKQDIKHTPSTAEENRNAHTQDSNIIPSKLPSNIPKGSINNEPYKCKNCTQTPEKTPNKSPKPYTNEGRTSLERHDNYQKSSPKAQLSNRPTAYGNRARKGKNRGATYSRFSTTNRGRGGVSTTKEDGTKTYIKNSQSSARNHQWYDTYPNES